MKKTKNLWTMVGLLALSFYLGAGSAAAAIDYYPKRTQWQPAGGTSMNISHYVYYDLNRNGSYDVGDRPLVHFAIKMTRPDGSTVVRRSNLNGFANFTNSALDSPVDVSEPGEYTFELILPPGWQVTSGNQVQKINYRLGTVERSSIIADQVPTPVGVIPLPRIEGMVKMANGQPAKNIEVIAIAPNQAQQKISTDQEGQFTIVGDYGEWTLKVKDEATKKEQIRKVFLGTAPVKMSAMILGQNELPQKPQQHLIDFEDITFSTIQKIPNGVGKVNWTNLIATDFLFYSGEGYINNRVSGKYIGYNTSGQPVEIAHPDGFDFYGGYFGVAWRTSAEGEILQVKAWRGDTLVDQLELELSALGPFYFDADYRNITRLELATKHYWQFVTDDLLIGTNN